MIDCATLNGLGDSFEVAGTRVVIRATPPYRRGKPGIVHLAEKHGTLIEDARIGPTAGWDVYDVRLDDGTETSAYGFDLALASIG